jgi:geranylgeranyl pyrophosphate synthase
MAPAYSVAVGPNQRPWIIVVVVGGHDEESLRASYLYGTYVGQAFQLIDDALDFEGTVQYANNETQVQPRMNKSTVNMFRHTHKDKHTCTFIHLISSIIRLWWPQVRPQR